MKEIHMFLQIISHFNFVHDFPLWDLIAQEEDLKSFRQWGSRTPGHPENFETPGVEVTTGWLLFLET